MKVEIRNEKKEIENNQFKKIETKELKKLIQRKEKEVVLATKEFQRRKDKPLSSDLKIQFENIVKGGMFIFFFGLFMLGAIPYYFNVNNEVTNPSVPIPSGDVFGTPNNVYELIGNSLSYVFKTFIETGGNNPKLFFWLFWIVVLTWLIIPIFKIIYYITRYIKNNKIKEVKQ